ncbi:MAG: hypothetical protein QOI06_2920 [Nocardioidaceae bacterium]|jgi:Rieske Fe-S protein|nr:hypothetical protein [Nocardioidaceae bacterium]
MAERETTTSDPNAESSRTREGSTVPNRRTMLKGLAVVGAAVPFLAACGSSGGSGSNAPNTPGPTKHTGSGGDPTHAPSSGGGGSADVITKASDVPVGGGVILPAKTIVVTQPTKGQYEGFSSTCTHMGCTVANISGGKIICPCHGSMYSIKDGSVLGGPAPLPLPKKPVKVEGTDIVPA